MNWTAIVVETSTEAVDAVSYILTDTGATGVKIDDAADYQKLKPGKYGPYGEIVDPSTLPHREEGAAVTGYYPPTTFVPEKIADIRQRVAKLADFGLNPAPARVAAEEIDNQDWATAWQKYYHPVRVTRELTIVPQWEEYTPATADEKLLVLDPGMAFGTGTHPTTQLMLQALTIALRGGESMIDVGTGSGVLSIAAKQLGAGEVWAYDIDDVAVKSADKNIELNPIAKDVHTGVTSLLDGIHTQVDLVVANILSNPLRVLAPAICVHVRSGGRLALSGILREQADEIIAIYRQWLPLQVADVREDWVCLSGVKP